MTWLNSITRVVQVTHFVLKQNDSFKMLALRACFVCYIHVHFSLHDMI